MIFSPCILCRDMILWREEGEVMKKILIVEDNEKLRDELKIFLNKNGYYAEILTKFDNVIENILNLNGDLILLDINLPILDGQYICKEVRKASDIPIIIITSRDNELDELISLNYGADDYITKPFNMQILLAKIVAILKRSNKSVLEQNKIDCGEFILNRDKSSIQKNEKTIELTKNEMRILQCLVRKKGQIVSRDDIISDLWDNESFIDDNTLTVNITRLRNKLEELDLKDLLETKRGQGYILI